MIIHNATVITFDQENRLLPDGAVRFSGAQIDAVGATAELLERYPDDEHWDAHGLLLMPGQICAHTHFYGAFARGMYIPGPPAKDFPEILQNLWWKLDKALDLDGVGASAEVCLADAIRHGTTTLIDHHASQTAIDGSLDVIADAVAQSGLRACLCYEVTDRDGSAAAQAGIRENVRFAEAGGKGERRRQAAPRLAPSASTPASRSATQPWSAAGRQEPASMSTWPNTQSTNTTASPSRAGAAWSACTASASPGLKASWPTASTSTPGRRPCWLRQAPS